MIRFISLWLLIVTTCYTALIMARRRLRFVLYCAAACCSTIIIEKKIARAGNRTCTQSLPAHRAATIRWLRSLELWASHSHSRSLCSSGFMLCTLILGYFVFFLCHFAPLGLGFTLLFLVVSLPKALWFAFAFSPTWDNGVSDSQALAIRSPAAD